MNVAYNLYIRRTESKCIDSSQIIPLSKVELIQLLGHTFVSRAIANIRNLQIDTLPIEVII